MQYYILKNTLLHAAFFYNFTRRGIEFFLIFLLVGIADIIADIVVGLKQNSADALPYRVKKVTKIA